MLRYRVTYIGPHGRRADERTQGHASCLGRAFSVRYARAHSGLDQLKSEGAVRYLLVSGERDDTTWGIIGAVWLSNDAERGGFLVSPDALWPGYEMARSYRGAFLADGADERIFWNWDDQTGSLGTYMIDPDVGSTH